MDKDAQAIDSGLTVMDMVDNPTPVVLTEHIIELLNAEQEGRLIVLPCKPGKRAYLVHDLRESEFSSVADITGPYDVYHANLKGFYIRSKRGMTFFVRWCEVGQTAFWSKEKAEAARDAIIAEDTNVPTKEEK